MFLFIWESLQSAVFFFVLFFLLGFLTVPLSPFPIHHLTVSHNNSWTQRRKREGEGEGKKREREWGGSNEQQQAVAFVCCTATHTHTAHTLHCACNAYSLTLNVIVLCPSQMHRVWFGVCVFACVCLCAAAAPAGTFIGLPLGTAAVRSATLFARTTSIASTGILFPSSTKKQAHFCIDFQGNLFFAAEVYAGSPSPTNLYKVSLSHTHTHIHTFTADAFIRIVHLPWHC